MNYTRETGRFFFDTTKFLYQRKHGSGLNRVSARLQDELGRLLGPHQYHPVCWGKWRRNFQSMNTGEWIGRGVPGDYFFSPEIFSNRERLGIAPWLDKFSGKSAHLFHDDIPLRFPEFTWPKSVRRFPRYLELTTHFKQSFAVSEASAESLRKRLAEWDLVEAAHVADVLCPGADFCPKEEIPEKTESEIPRFLMVGILEPRKGQYEVLKACENLWKKKYRFSVTVLGRVNPHFGAPIMELLVRLRKEGYHVEHLDKAGDQELVSAFANHDLLLFPSRAEGFGLPVLEALWCECPVLCSAVPVRTIAERSGGVLSLEEISSQAIEEMLEPFLTKPERLNTLRASIQRSSLPRWADMAEKLIADCPFM